MDVQMSEKYRLTALLTVVGGFLEAYTFLTRGGVFANAQTGNIARLGLAAAGGDLHAVLRYLLPIVSFIAGVSLSIQIRACCRRYPSRSFHWRQIVVLAETALLAIVGLIPAEAPDLSVTGTVSFVCALQVESFRKFHGNVFASTMCTGNLRSATEDLNHYFETRDRGRLVKSLMYFAIDLFFICGVTAGYFAVLYLGRRAVWVCSAFLAAAFCMMSCPKGAPGEDGEARKL